MKKSFLLSIAMLVCLIALPVLGEGSDGVKAPDMVSALPLSEVVDPIPTEIGKVVGFFPVLIAAWKSGQWLMVGAVLSLMLTFAFRKFLLPSLKLGSGVLPLVSAALGVIAGVGAAIIGGADMASASMAVLSGPLASTLWDSLVKYFFKKQ